MSKGTKNSATTKVLAEFSVSSLVSILLDGLDETRNLVGTLERDSALDGRTREQLALHFERLARLVAEAEIFRTTLQVRINNLCAGSAQVQRLASVGRQPLRLEGHVSGEPERTEEVV